MEILWALVICGVVIITAVCIRGAIAETEVGKQLREKFEQEADRV